MESEIKPDSASQKIEASKTNNINALSVSEPILHPQNAFSSQQVLPKCLMFPTESVHFTSENSPYSKSTYILHNTSQLSLTNKQIATSPMNLLSSTNTHKMCQTSSSSYTMSQSNCPRSLPSNIPPLPPGLTISFEKPPLTVPESEHPLESFPVISTAAVLHSNLLK